MHETRKRVASILLVTSGLLLAGCGGAEDGKESSFTPGGGATPSPSAPSAAAGTVPANLSLPADVKLVFDIKPTGDPAEDKILRDFANANRAQYRAVFDNQPYAPLPRLYHADGALLSVVQYLQAKQKSGTVVTGTKRYYDITISERNPDAAKVAYCEDESRFYSKARATGKVLATTPSPKSYALVKVTVHRNAKTGIWEQVDYLPQGGARQCQPGA